MDWNTKLFGNFDILKIKMKVIHLNNMITKQSEKREIFPS